MTNIEIMISKGIDEDIAEYLDTYASEGFPNMYLHFVNLDIDDEGLDKVKPTRENYRFLANQLIDFVRQGLTE